MEGSVGTILQSRNPLLKFSIIQHSTIYHSVKLYDDPDIEPARGRVKETGDFPPLSRVALNLPVN